MKKLIPWESSCFSISPEFFVVWLIYSDEELLAAKRNRLVVNRTFSGRRFAGCLPFFMVGQGGVSEKQEAACGGGSQSIVTQKIQQKFLHIGKWSRTPMFYTTHLDSIYFQVSL